MLQSLYGVGTDITVSQQAKMDQGGSQRFSMKPPDESKQGEEFDRSAVMTAPGQQSMSDQEAHADRRAGRREQRHRQHHHAGDERAG